jgi:hypothetical protein
MRGGEGGAATSQGFLTILLMLPQLLLELMMITPRAAAVEMAGEPAKAVADMEDGMSFWTTALLLPRRQRGTETHSQMAILVTARNRGLQRLGRKMRIILPLAVAEEWSRE